MIQEIKKVTGAVADGKDAFAAIDLLFGVCDLACTIEVKVAVAHELRVHAEIFHIRVGDHAADRIGDAADAELERAAAGNIGEDVGGYLPVDIRGKRGFDRRDREIALYDRVNILNVDMVVGNAGDGRHRGVDLHNDMLRHVQDLLHGTVGEAVGKVAAAIHGCHGDHGNVDRRIAFAVIRAVMAEQHRHMISASLIDVFAVQGRAVPEIIGKRAAGVILNRLHRDHADRVAQFDVVQLTAAPRERRVQRLRERACLAVVHPVAVLDDLYRLVRRAELLSVKGLIIHNLLPPDRLKSPAPGIFRAA